MRAKWKFPAALLKFRRPRNVVENSAGIISRRSLGSRVNVYNGRTYISFLIRQNMKGQRMRSFVLSKRLGHSIHQKKKHK